MASKKRFKDGDDEEDEHEKRKEKAKKSIFERENIFKKPYEKEWFDSRIDLIAWFI